MGKGTSKVPASKREKSFDDYPKDVIDTLIVKRGDKTVIEKYDGQDLETYDHLLEINHSKLLDIAWQAGMKNSSFRKYYGNITLTDVFEYWKKHFNFKGL